MGSNFKKRAGVASWAAVALIAVVYGPMAIEYMWRFFNPDAPGLWDRTFSTVVDREEAYAAGSIHAEQSAEYARVRWVLLFHTTAGGIAIMLFAAQFSARLRRNLARHRIVGRVAVSFSLVGMLGAMGYLLAIGPDATFDGPGFYIQLWLLAIGTTIGTVLGFAAAVRRQIAMHQAFMAYAFALLLTAPLLRGFYLLLGNAWPETTQLETNFAGAAFLATWAPFGAFLAARAQDHRQRRSSAIGPLPGRHLDATVLVVSALAAVAVVRRYAAEFDGLDRVTTTGLVGLATAIAVAVTNLGAANRNGAWLAAEEWRIVLLSLLAAAPVAVVMWPSYDFAFATHDAYLGTLLTAPAVPLSIGFVLVVWRRRRVGRPASPATVLADTTSGLQGTPA